jgi:plastocyanin
MRIAKSTRLASVLAVLLLTAVAAVALYAPAGAATPIKHVTIANYAFSPHTIRIKAGTTVVWTNTQGVTHELVSVNSMQRTPRVTKRFDSGALAQGATFSYTYKKKGTFYYECIIHAYMASMHAKVIVR